MCRVATLHRFWCANSRADYRFISALLSAINISASYLFVQMPHCAGEIKKTHIRAVHYQKAPQHKPSTYWRRFAIVCSPTARKSFEIRILPAILYVTSVSQSISVLACVKKLTES